MIIYEKVGERIIRIARCWHCGADVILRPDQHEDVRALCKVCLQERGSR